MAVRAGLTLLELLIVLVILGITAALVVPQLTTGVRFGAADPQIRSAALDSAHRLAVRKGVTVRLRVQDDGGWSVVIPGATEPLASGQLPAPAPATDITVDPLGVCRPASGRSPTSTAGPMVFDAGRCRWNTGGDSAEGTPP